MSDAWLLPRHLISVLVPRVQVLALVPVLVDPVDPVVRAEQLVLRVHHLGVPLVPAGSVDLPSRQSSSAATAGTTPSSSGDPTCAPVPRSS